MCSCVLVLYVVCKHNGDYITIIQPKALISVIYWSTTLRGTVGLWVDIGQKMNLKA